MKGPRKKMENGQGGIRKYTKNMKNSIRWKNRKLTEWK